MRYRVITGCLVVLFVGASAAGISPAAASEELPSLVLVPWVTKIKRQRAEQDWAGALDTARSGISRFVALEPEDRVSALIIALGVVQDYVDLYGGSAELDAEARAYHQEGLRLATETGQRARLDHVLALYYSATGRSGLAAPLLRREAEYWESAGDYVQLMVTYASLGSLAGDMGQDPLRDHYREKALAVAKANYVFGLEPEGSHPWLVYVELLKARMDDVAGPAGADRILELWRIAGPIYHKYMALPHKGYLRVAVELAVSGAHEQAEDFLRKARREWKRKAAQHPKLAAAARRDLDCGEAQLSVHAQRFVMGAKQIEDCIRQTQAIGVKPDLTLYRLQGMALEAVGKLDRAVDAYRRSIEVAEVARSSFSLAERITFFRNGAQRSYWGLVRSLTRRALRDRDEGDFLSALQASEQLRGRQLGEVLGSKTGEEVPLKQLRRFRSKLPTDSVVLSYMFTDSEIVILGFDRKGWRASVISDGSSWRANLRSLAAALAEPASSLADIDRTLSRLGKLLLQPMAGLFRDKENVIVLPDAELNLLPFDLLREPVAEGRALLEGHVVRAAPSLRYLLRDSPESVSSPSIFALADPVYRQDYQLEGVSDSTMRSLTRGSDYLSYFSPLPETRDEVEAIAQLFSPEKVRTLYGRQAAESQVKSVDLRPFRYLHFATHGILGGEVPGVAEPALVLSREAGDDGFLTASEAAGLSLRASLTVLSACKTGSGEFVTGEGVLGMSRSFLVAGSKSVVVSLWSVDSRATQELMVLFYRQLDRGLDPAGALRAAKLEMIERTRAGEGRLRGVRLESSPGSSTGTLHPFYWAAFIVIGA